MIVRDISLNGHRTQVAIPTTRNDDGTFPSWVLVEVAIQKRAMVSPLSLDQTSTGWLRPQCDCATWLDICHFAGMDADDTDQKCMDLVEAEAIRFGRTITQIWITNREENS